MTHTATIPTGLLSQEESQLHDAGSERAFLAMLIKQPGMIVEAEQAVSPEWLFHQVHAYIYRCMLFLHQQAIDQGWPLCLDDLSMFRAADYCGRRESFLTQTRNGQHVRDLMDLAQRVDIAQWRPVLAEMKASAMRVFMYRQARQVMVSVLDRQANPDVQKVAMEAETGFSRVLQHSADDDSRFGKLAEHEDTFYRKAQIVSSNPGAGLFHIGVEEFSRLMRIMSGGFRRKGLTVIAARPKVGKSTLLQEFARQAAVKRSVPTLVFDTEMSREEVYTRMLAAEADLPEIQLLKGEFFGNGQVERVSESLVRLREAPLYYCNVNGRSIDYVTSVMQQFRTHAVGERQVVDIHGQELTCTGHGLVIYDWIKLPNASGLKHAQETQLLGDLCSQIKDAARHMDLPVVAGAQNNRGAVGMKGRDFAFEGESYVGGSDRIAQFCTTLCLLRNVDREEEDLIRQVFPTRPGDHADHRNGLYFNQVLHIMLQRQGSDCRDGIPLYLERGKSRYQEVASAPDGSAFPEPMQWLRNQNSRDRGKVEMKAVMPVTEVLQQQAAQARAVPRDAAL